MKASGIPEVERKPAQPYTAPAHSSEKNKKIKQIDCYYRNYNNNIRFVLFRISIFWK